MLVLQLKNVRDAYLVIGQPRNRLHITVGFVGLPIESECFDVTRSLTSSCPDNKSWLHARCYRQLFRA
jgi:hypothetical protein